MKKKITALVLTIAMIMSFSTVAFGELPAWGPYDCDPNGLTAIIETEYAD